MTYREAVETVAELERLLQIAVVNEIYIDISSEDAEKFLEALNTTAN